MTLFKTQRAFARGASLLFLIAAASGVVAADTIPLGLTAAAVDLYGGNGQLCENSDVNSATCSVNGATSTALVANGHGGMASVTLGGTATEGAAVTEYYFGIEGPVSESVPIVINGYANTQDSGQPDSYGLAAYFVYQGSLSGASYSLTYFGSANTCAYLANISDVSCRSTGNFAIDTTVTSNSAFFIFLEAAAAGTNASALIDPTISIDPSFGDASEFTLVSNPGVFTTNSPSAPEPASIGLFGCGVCLLTALWRRLGRRQATLILKGSEVSLIAKSLFSDRG